MAVHKQDWTEAQDAIMREGYGTWERRRLQSAVGSISPDGRSYSWSAVVGRANRLGLSRERAPAWTDAQVQFLAANYANLTMGALVDGVAKLGAAKTIAAIHTFAFRRGFSRPLSPPPVHTKGSRKPAVRTARPAPQKAVRKPAQPQRQEAAPQQHVQSHRNALRLFASGVIVPELRTIAAGEPDTAHEKVVSKQEKAWNLLWKGRDASDVARDTGLMLREVLRINMDVREARRAQRAA
jgi:hypothetical protein